MGYLPADVERFGPEEPKLTRRLPFARDRARVLHCAALRRLAAKTQVLAAGESDIPRTRLTHTLEVAQVSREIGQALGADPDLVEAAALAHDIGHPPFGHNGESVLHRLADSCGGFEGNAQSFRVLTRLEAKVHHGEVSVGLNLTRATLDAATKYPWPASTGASKFGVYDDDRPVFDWMRSDAPGQRRCLEAQVMDWADDVAYSVHDVEDAVVLGHLPLPSLRSVPEQDDVVAVAHRGYAPGIPVEALREALLRLMGLSVWPHHFDGTHQDLAVLKGLTSTLIGRFALAAQDATAARFGPGPHRRYGADLVVPESVRAEVAVMKGVTFHFVMQRPGANLRYQFEHDLIEELVAALLASDGAELDGWLRASWCCAASDEQRLRVVVDQVASLTDVSIVRWHDRICR